MRVVTKSSRNIKINIMVGRNKGHGVFLVVENANVKKMLHSGGVLIMGWSENLVKFSYHDRTFLLVGFYHGEKITKCSQGNTVHTAARGESTCKILSLKLLVLIFSLMTYKRCCKQMNNNNNNNHNRFSFKLISHLFI